MQRAQTLLRTQSMPLCTRCRCLYISLGNILSNPHTNNILLQYATENLAPSHILCLPHIALVLISHPFLWDMQYAVWMCCGIVYHDLRIQCARQQKPSVPWVFPISFATLLWISKYALATSVPYLHCKTNRWTHNDDYVNIFWRQCQRWNIHGIHKQIKFEDGWA